ncbi:DJ-1 family glyoxalase III [Haploplasma axanthum]|uniref:DJ-1/PfpI family protein n=1 Tax=Haploplasma axanthum TaxID=29552 RepID=A0A449BCT5_HAPAX|nr:DJ-1 family glyoxalase III [Haploplasma axanthum]VEU80263.1 DJ-1/PfpI family protein [Haploplasma axanthum]
MKKGLILLNNNVEDIESLATRDLLIRSGYNITTFTLEKELDIKTAYNMSIKVDKLIKDIDEVNFDFLVLPGGKHVSEWVNQKTPLNRLINEFNDNGKLIAAICAAPLFLSKAGILKDKDYTAFPSVVNDIEAIYHSDAKVVKTGNVITARSAGVTFDFAFEIVNYLDGNDAVNKLKKNIIY